MSNKLGLIVFLIVGQLVNSIPAVNNKNTLSLAEIATDDFGKNIVSLLSIHATLGDPVEDLQNSLNEMRTHLEEEERWDSNTWELEKNDLESTIEFNDQCFQSSAANVASFNQQYSDAQDRLGSLNTLIDQLSSDLESLNARLATHQQMVIDEQAAFDERQGKDTEGVDACNTAIRILQGFPSSGASLIQIDEFKELTLKISQRAMKEGSAFQPLISALTTLVEMDDVSPNACQEIITLLTELRDSIAASQTRDALNFGTNLEMWTNTTNDMLAQQENLETNLSDQETKRGETESVISTIDELLPIEEGVRDDCQATFNSATATFNTKSGDFARRQQIRAEQLEVLDRLDDFVVNNMQEAYDELSL